MDADICFKVLEYNTHLFLDTVVEPFVEKPYDEERRQEIAKRVHDFDIVGLNEVWSNNSKRIIGTEFSKDWCYDDNNNPLQMGSGLVILSKFRILSHSFTEYNDLTSSDAYSQKGFLTAKINFKDELGQDILFVVTHMQSGTNEEEKKLERKTLNN